MEKLKMNVSNVLKFLEEKIGRFDEAENLKFTEFVKEPKSPVTTWRPKTKKLDYRGVYVIYDETDNPIYIGSAGKGNHFLRFRIANLFQYSPKSKKPTNHTLTAKLLKQKFSGNIESVRNYYLNSCSFKVVETGTVRQARMLENVLIELLNPKYNT